MHKLRQNHQEKIDEIIQRFPQKKSATLPLLYLAWDVYGYISKEAMEEVADILDMSPAHIEGIASFYTMFPLKPTGKYHIELCTNISCHLTGAQKIKLKLEELLGISSGQTTDDGLFSIQAVECLAGCSWAPCMHINGKEYQNLTPEKVEEIIESLKTTPAATN